MVKNSFVKVESRSSAVPYFVYMKKTAFILLLLFPYLAFSQARITTVQYISEYSGIAITEMNKYGIPASVKLGQGILESSSGNSDLAKNAKNHFGIKCKKEWVGPTYTMDDDAKNECFRKYETVLASYEDHSLFLKNSARYAELFTYEKNDYRSWATGLKKAGYATNPQYTALLIKTIEDNKLNEFDSPGAVTAFQEPKKDKSSAGPQISAAPKRTGNQTGDLTDFELKKANQRSVFTRNEVKYVLAKAGDTYESIAREMDLMAWQLPKYNDAAKNVVLKADEVVFIQPKRRKANDATHVVKQGETIRDVSQLYAIKLSRLYDINAIGEGLSVKAGTVLKLK